MITVDGQVVKTDRRKAIALLAYLAVTGKSHTREHLAALLWPDYPQESAYAYLRRALWELNQILGKGWIQLDQERLALGAAPELYLDTAAFTRLSQSSANGVQTLQEAIALYRGEFLEGFLVADTAPFEDWQIQQSEHFRREFAGVLARLVNALAQAGSPENALPYAHRWLGLDALNEAAQRALLRLLAQMGDRTGAIRQYEACVQLLKAELGVPPEAETTQLYQAILRGELRPAPTASAEPAPAPPNGDEPPRPALRLPAMPTPFIGRRSEVEQIKELLLNPAQRLVTLTGPGGSGKTRLSLQAASELGEAFPDGVYFIPLAAVSAPAAVLPALAKELDCAFYGDERPRQQFVGFLRGKQLLLVLDNFEHLLEAADLLNEILTSTRQVKLLVTSRVRLNMQGEQLFTVNGMHIPAANQFAAWADPERDARPFSGMQLFIERARRVQPSFVLTHANLAPVAQICQLVQGMPLGLELAAAWLELLPPVEIAAEIERSLDFLATEQSGVPDRQRSIRAVFESSWRILSAEEQITLQRLCVFRGSFGRESAQQVSQASLRTLLGLVNKSWLQQSSDGRFHIHELLRHYVLELLKTNPAEWRRAHDRHAAYFTEFITRQTALMQSPDQLAGMTALEAELNTNVKAAWDWLANQSEWDTLITHYLEGLFQFGISHERMDELLQWFRDARQKLEAGLRPETHLAYAIMSVIEIDSADYVQIQDFDPLGRLTATWQFVHRHQLAEAMGFWFALLAAMIHVRNLDSDSAHYLDVALAQLRKANQPWQLGIALLIQSTNWGDYILNTEKMYEAAQIFKDLGLWYEQGLVAELFARYAIQKKEPIPVILAHYQQARHFFSHLGEDVRVTILFIYLSGMYFREGLVEQGFAVHHETQRILEKAGNLRTLAVNYHWESLHAMRYSNREHALAKQQRALELLQKTDNQSDYYWALFELGEIYRIFGEPHKASPSYEQALAGFKKMNMILALGYYQRGYGDLALAAGNYDEALRRFDLYLKQAIQDNHAWSVAQAHTKRATALAHLGQTSAARQELAWVLNEIRTWGEDELYLLVLLAEGACLAAEGKYEQALELAALVQHHPVSWHEFKQAAAALSTRAGRELPDEVTEAALARGKQLKLEGVIAALTPPESPTSAPGVNPGE